MSSTRSLSILTSVIALTLAAGCRTVDINVDDRDRLSPSGRVSYEFLPGNDQRRRGTALDLVRGRLGDADADDDADDDDAAADEETADPRRKVQPTISIDGEVTYVEGRDRQAIDAGNEAELGNVIFPGPTTVRTEATNVRAHVAARGGVRLWDVLSLEAILGIGLNDTEVRLQSVGLDSREENLRAGLLWGARGTVRPIALIDLYIQYTQNFMADAFAEDLQVGAELNLTRNIAVFGGYRWWEYEEESFGSGSDIDLDIRGPTTGLSLKF